MPADRLGIEVRPGDDGAGQRGERSAQRIPERALTGLPTPRSILSVEKGDGCLTEDAGLVQLSGKALSPPPAAE